MHILEDDLPLLSEAQKDFIRAKLAEDWSCFDSLIEHRNSSRFSASPFLWPQQPPSEEIVMSSGAQMMWLTFTEEERKEQIRQLRELIDERFGRMKAGRVA